MNIYLLTRSPDLSRSVGAMLRDQELDYQFESLTTVDDLKATEQPKGLILLDADMPGSECMATLRRLDRDLASYSVVVIVGAALADQVMPGFEGMRHLVSPFHKSDLLNSITAEGVVAPRGTLSLTVGRLMLNLVSRKAYVDEQLVPLTGKEFEVLQLLASRKGVTLSKEMFLDKLYGGLDEPEVKIIDVFVCKIRGKLKKLTGGDGLIDTVWGRGYVLRSPETRQLQQRAAS